MPSSSGRPMRASTSTGRPGSSPCRAGAIPTASESPITTTVSAAAEVRRRGRQRRPGGRRQLLRQHEVHQRAARVDRHVLMALARHQLHARRPAPVTPGERDRGAVEPAARRADRHVRPGRRAPAQRHVRGDELLAERDRRHLRAVQRRGDLDLRGRGKRPARAGRAALRRRDARAPEGRAWHPGYRTSELVAGHDHARRGPAVHVDLPARAAPRLGRSTRGQRGRVRDPAAGPDVWPMRSTATLETRALSTCARAAAGSSAADARRCAGPRAPRRRRARPPSLRASPRGGTSGRRPSRP